MECFWDDIAKSLFEAMTPLDISYQRRSIKAIRNKFGIVQHQVSKFAGHYSRAKRNRASGANDDDVYDAAVVLFERLEGGEFRHRDCWDILRHEPKFMGSVGGGNGDSEGAKAGQDVPRPIGQKKAKEERVESATRHSEVKELRRLANAVADRNRLLEVQTALAVMTQAEPDDPVAKEYLALIRSHFLATARSKRPRSPSDDDSDGDDGWGDEEKKDDSDEDDSSFPPTALV